MEVKFKMILLIISDVWSFQEKINTAVKLKIQGKIESSLIHFCAEKSGNEYIFMILLVISVYSRFMTPNSY